VLVKGQDGHIHAKPDFLKPVCLLSTPEGAEGIMGLHYGFRDTDNLYNLVKLVRDPVVAATYLGPLVVGVDKIAKGAAFPEVRAVLIEVLVTDRDLRFVLSQKVR
jgi:hypothetical protein